MGGRWASIEWSQRVFWGSKAKGGCRLVLLALAAHCDEAGCCWPSIARLATMTGLDGDDNYRQVRRAIRRLEQLGELAVERNRGPHGHSSRYRLLVGQVAGTVLQDSPSAGETAIDGVSPETVRPEDGNRKKHTRNCKNGASTGADIARDCLLRPEGLSSETGGTVSQDTRSDNEETENRHSRSKHEVEGWFGWNTGEGRPLSREEIEVLMGEGFGFEEESSFGTRVVKP